MAQRLTKKRVVASLADHQERYQIMVDTFEQHGFEEDARLARRYEAATASIILDLGLSEEVHAARHEARVRAAEGVTR